MTCNSRIDGLGITVTRTPAARSSSTATPATRRSPTTACSPTTAGLYGGGIRVGHPVLTFDDRTPACRRRCRNNDDVSIHYNQVIFQRWPPARWRRPLAAASRVTRAPTPTMITEQLGVRQLHASANGGGIGHVRCKSATRPDLISRQHHLSSTSSVQPGPVNGRGRRHLHRWLRAGSHCPGRDQLRPGSGDVTIDSAT